MIIGSHHAEAFSMKRLGDLFEEIVAPRKPSDEDDVLHDFLSLLPLQGSCHSPIQADGPFSSAPTQRSRYTVPRERRTRPLQTYNAPVIRADLVVRAIRLPRQFHLPNPDAALPIIISCASKLDVLRLMWVLEPELRGLVEAGDDVVEVVEEG